MDLVCVNCRYTNPFPINQFKSRAPIRASSSSFNSIRRRRRRSKCSVRISNFAASVTENSTTGAVTKASTSTAGAGDRLLLGKWSAAMEQLDIERGVCIPFRKYTPETVWITHLNLLAYIYMCIYICYGVLDF